LLLDFRGDFKQIILTARIGDDCDYCYEATTYTGSGLTLSYLERNETIEMREVKSITLNREEALELAAAIKLFFGENDAYHTTRILPS
jgi:hypothetical protein